MATNLKLKLVFVLTVAIILSIGGVSGLTCYECGSGDQDREGKDLPKCTSSEIGVLKGCKTDPDNAGMRCTNFTYKENGRVVRRCRPYSLKLAPALKKEQYCEKYRDGLECTCYTDYCNGPPQSPPSPPSQPSASTPSPTGGPDSSRSGAVHLNSWAPAQMSIASITMIIFVAA